jgi:hypothetical protein
LRLAFLTGMTLDQPVPRMKSSHGIYALLLAANLIMGTVIMEQGRVIETQRVLIKVMFYDNIHNAGMKLKRAVDRH